MERPGRATRDFAAATMMFLLGLTRNQAPRIRWSLAPAKA